MVVVDVSALGNKELNDTLRKTEGEIILTK